LTAGPEVVVVANFVLKQPAGLAGTIEFQGRLVVAGMSTTVAATVQLKAGALAAFAGLTIWIVEQ
jgi:hypothetical protein